MNPIYYDGTKYYKVGKHKDGSYVKFEVDNVGTYWWAIVDEYLTHDWYILVTCLEALVSGVFDTWFMDYATYLYD